ncbi:hypothetical protein HY251_13865, partial [bacterium]|nr:hypothetical protein [bacterium]
MAKLRMALAGGRRHGTACLRALLEAGVDVCAVFGYPPTPSEQEVEEPVCELARKAGVPYHDEPDLRTKPAKALLRELAPDAVLAVKWRRLFDAEALAIPKRGTFVVHDSLLPHLRGAAPLNWVLILGEKDGERQVVAAGGVEHRPADDGRVHPDDGQVAQRG